MTKLETDLLRTDLDRIELGLRVLYYSLADQEWAKCYREIKEVRADFQEFKVRIGEFFKGGGA